LDVPKKPDGTVGDWVTSWIWLLKWERGFMVVMIAIVLPKVIFALI
jgi:hypothetical protein